jgi:trehalose 6-phosphate phosphatase
MADKPCSPLPGEAVAGAWALFLDFDGTLADIAEHPEAVSFPSALANLLARLRDRLDGALAIISGRPVAVLDGFLAPHQFDMAGLHGAEVRTGGRIVHSSAVPSSDLQNAAQALSDRLPPDPGLFIEDKGYSIAVHWRQAPQHEEAALKLAGEIVNNLGPRYRLQKGKAVAEILPANSDKGRAIEILLDQPLYRERRPIFIGDDLTDEDGFGVVNRLNGVSVRVGAGGTAARYRLANPQAVRNRLTVWAEGGPINPEKDFEP